jgi:hypothetical protein
MGSLAYSTMSDEALGTSMEFTTKNLEDGSCGGGRE